ncbi:cytochrome b/b6 domain-containing protein [Roseibaca sp. Y0-43]|uniref:cytochrome b/b6 domain-containing protein n=1 Tax=Roseibaca sp. Y0-43 TaxID=2816854 RepID=UPI001D0BF577|nr:cytochrome b/b6 domain-containing protein [Roseibaca sp. Y0-43]MCC1481698.1 cytochrome b/b6 domain-containing protein [Roseibaca sp. Y0-43]
MVERKVKIFTRFNRLWHWSQVISIMLLLFTGFRLNGLHELIRFQVAAGLHTVVALALLLLWAFVVFWLFTTDAWKNFIPTRRGLWQVIKYYAYGVFKGAEHPYRKVFHRRHNPLQLLAYLALKLMLFPAIWVSGLIYLAYGLWSHVDGASFLLQIVANIHILSGFAIAAFVVVHVYLLTLGHGFRSHVRPMVTGFDTVELTPEEEAFLKTSEPWRLQDDPEPARVQG